MHIKCNAKVLQAALSVMAVMGSASLAFAQGVTADPWLAAVEVRQGEVAWGYSGARDEDRSLEVALSSKRISRVIFFVGNRYTSDTLGYKSTARAWDVAVSYRRHGVLPVILRGLWRTQPHGAETDVDILTDPSFYMREIKALRAEARSLGGSLCGFDTEGHGPTPIGDLFREKKHSRPLFLQIEAAVLAAVAEVGPVDYVFPAGSFRRDHPYAALANIGKLRIADGTYWDRDPQPEIPYTYHLRGMYANTSKTHERHATLEYYLPSEIFGVHRELWHANGGGLFIWPRENRALPIARYLKTWSDVILEWDGTVQAQALRGVE